MTQQKFISSDLAFQSGFNRVSDSCALFYLLFVSICHDTGWHVYDIEEISIKTGKRWHKGHIKSFVRSLSTRGLLEIYSDSTRLQVVNWSWHCKTAPKPELIEVKTPVELNVEPKKKRAKNAALSEGQLELTRQVWDAYKEAYYNRYTTEPVRNAKVNAQIKQLVERLGVDAPEVIKFYLNHSDFFYLKSLHSLGPLLMNCEALHTQWKTGQKITSHQAKQIEKVDEHKEQVNRLKELIDEKYSS